MRTLIALSVLFFFLPLKGQTNEQFLPYTGSLSDAGQVKQLVLGAEKSGFLVDTATVDSLLPNGGQTYGLIQIWGDSSVIVKIRHFPESRFSLEGYAVESLKDDYSWMPKIKFVDKRRWRLNVDQ